MNTLILSYAVNTVNEPWLVVLIAGLGIALAVSVLWSAFEPKPQPRRFDRRKHARFNQHHTRRAASASGRW